MPKRKPLDPYQQCAACGATPVVTETTFLCCNVERYICDGCWSKGENNEAWDLDIGNEIQLRDRKQARALKPAKRKKR